MARYEPERGIDSASRSNASRRILPTSVPVVRRGSVQASFAGCGMLELGCVLTANPRSRESISPAPVLDLLAWGADPLSFEWFEPPSADRIQAALRLLQRLGAIDATAQAPHDGCSAVSCSAFRFIRASRGF